MWFKGEAVRVNGTGKFGSVEDLYRWIGQILFERLAQNGMEMHELIVTDSHWKCLAAHRSGR